MPLQIFPDPSIPLPDDFDPEEPTSFRGKVNVAAKTAKVLLEAGADIPVTKEDTQTAEDMFKALLDPENSPIPTPAFASKTLSSPAVVQHLTAMLTEYDHQIIADAVQLRRYITNKLLEDSNLPDPRHRLRALELLGKISDVGLFTEKTEMTVKAEGVEDLEAQIKSKLTKILNASTVIDASFEVVEKEMGTITPDDLKGS